MFQTSGGYIYIYIYFPHCFQKDILLRVMSSIDLHSRGSTWHRVKAIGRGGFASVFLATYNDKLLAVKTVELDNSNYFSNTHPAETS